MDFRSNKLFMKSIKENNILGIKSSLEGFINKFHGDKLKCDEAIDYAIKNSSFDWEEDDNRYLGKQRETLEAQYYYESERLSQNFTKERYLKVLDLYKKYKGTNSNQTTTQSSQSETKKKTSTPQKINIQKNNTPSKAMIGILIVAVLLILFFIKTIVS